jgi:hypothetical protein
MLATKNLNIIPDLQIKSKQTIVTKTFVLLFILDMDGVLLRIKSSDYI